MIVFFSFLILFIRKFLDLLLGLFTLEITLKFVLLISFIFIFHYIKIYPKLQRLKLSNLRKIRRKFPNKYILKTYNDHIINILIIIIYPLVFIFGILYLRFSNINKSINLLYYFEHFKSSILIISNLDFILTLSLFMCFFRFYILIIRHIIKLIRFEIIKRHLF